MKKKILSIALVLIMCLSLAPVFAGTAQAASNLKIGKYANNAVRGGEFSWHIILNADNTFELVTGDFEGIYTERGTWTADSSGNITANIDNGESVILTAGGSDVLILWNTPLYYDPAYSVSDVAPATNPQEQNTISLIDTMKPYVYTDLGNYVNYVLWYPTSGEESLSLAGYSYKNALALHEAPATIYAKFNLDGKYSSLSSNVGMADAGGRYEDDPPVTVNIYGDDKLLQTLDIKMGDLPVGLLVDVSGVRALKFEIAPQTLYRATVIGFVNLKLR